MNGTLLACLALAYPAFYVLYFLFVALAGRLNRVTRVLPDTKPGKFAILIAAYAEDEVLVSSVQHCLLHNYPPDRFTVFLALEAHRPETMRALHDLPVRILQTRGTKGRALGQLLESVGEDFDHVLILDADNTLAPGCLWELNASLSMGVRAIQGQRQAKNSNNGIAILDGISEAINNHLFRKGQNAIGLSASLIGSGMAFERCFIKRLIPSVEGIWEDRELELRILAEQVSILYLETAVVFDEKVSKPGVFLGQRTKWVGGQFAYLRRTLATCFRSGPTPDLLNKALHAFAPPRSVLLGILLLTLCVQVLTGAYPVPVMALVFLFLLTLLISLPANLVKRLNLQTILSLLLLIGMMLVIVPLSLIRGRHHYHTPHVVK